jgi:uncharacterized protein YcaQ
MAASDLGDSGRRGKYAGAWSWNDGKRVMTWLQLAGRVAVAGRRNIEQLYDLTERVIPRKDLEAPAPDPEDAKRELLVFAARAMGVATQKDLATYFSTVVPTRRPPASRRWSPISWKTVACCQCASTAGATRRIWIRQRVYRRRSTRVRSCHPSIR